MEIPSRGSITTTRKSFWPLTTHAPVALQEYRLYNNPYPKIVNYSRPAVYDRFPFSVSGARRESMSTSSATAVLALDILIAISALYRNIFSACSFLSTSVTKYIVSTVFSAVP